jgi:acyl transferase domain-containing protein
VSRPLDIAIVGLAGVYPGAKDARAFWQNICAKVDAISDAPADWVGPYWRTSIRSKSA